jgi:divalent metal cation (Fe/Co/Zn/Cd) transporter
MNRTVSQVARILGVDAQQIKTWAWLFKEHPCRAFTLRFVGWCFLTVAAYVAYDSVKAILLHEAPKASLVGVMIALFSIIAMPVLARAKRKVAHAIGSAALNADAKQTELCFYLSAILLGGLLPNALMGWWWSDPLAALVVVPVIAKEGIGALRGQSCGCETCH